MHPGIAPVSCLEADYRHQEGQVELGKPKKFKFLGRIKVRRETSVLEDNDRNSLK